MCEAVVGLSKPLKFTSTRSVLATLSYTTVAAPVPGEPVAGTSVAPFRFAVNSKESALAMAWVPIMRSKVVSFLFMVTAHAASDMPLNRTIVEVCTKVLRGRKLTRIEKGAVVYFEDKYYSNRKRGLRFGAAVSG